jgi:hypothetical protein
MFKPSFCIFSSLLKNLFPYIFVMENTYNVFLLLLYVHVLSMYRGIGKLQWRIQNKDSHRKEMARSPRSVACVTRRRLDSHRKETTGIGHCKEMWRRKNTWPSL